MADVKRVGVGFGVMLIRRDKILLGRRNSDPVKASSALHGEGTWTMPGGKLRFGESFEDAASREVKEETGITIRKESLKLISLSNNIVNDAHFVTLGFLCDEFSGEARLMEPDEITEWKWFSLRSLPSPLFEPSKQVLENFHADSIYQNVFSGA